MEQPTTQELSDQIIASIEASINQTIPLLPKAFNRVIAKVFAAVFILLYKYGGFIFLQMFPSSASFKEINLLGFSFNPLISLGRLIGAGDPAVGEQAELEIQIQVDNQVGSLKSGEQLTNSNNGITYSTVTAVLLDSQFVNVVVRAIGDQAGGNGTGALGNLEVGDFIDFVQPQPNVQQRTTVSNQVVTGANAETADQYRQRVIDRWQKRPQGGAAVDYEVWGEEVSGIINVYPYSGDVAGDVDCYSEATVASSGSVDGIPTAAQLLAIKESIEFDDNGLASRRPFGSFVNSFPIERTYFDISVSGIQNVQDIVQVQTDVQTALELFMLDREPFIDGLTVGLRKDEISLNALTAVVQDIVEAANGTFAGLIFQLSGGASPNLQTYTLGQGEKSKAENVAFA